MPAFLYGAAIAAPLALLMFLMAYGLSKGASRLRGTPELCRKQFMTPNEVEFYHRLNRALAGQFIVMAQVSLASLVDNKLKRGTHQYWELRKAYSGKVADYVACDAKTLEPLVIIELDDVTHDFSKDAKRDGFTALAGLRTVRFWSRKKPSDAEILQRVLRETGRQNAYKV